MSQVDEHSLRGTLKCCEYSEAQQPGTLAFLKSIRLQTSAALQADEKCAS